MAIKGPFDRLPNEVTSYIFSYFSRKDLMQIMQVNSLWKFLGRAWLNHFFQKEYPYLVTQECPKNLTNSEIIALIEKQKKIYDKLAERYQLSSQYLQRSFLDEFSSESYEEDKIFTTSQIRFLEEFMIASDAAEGNPLENMGFRSIFWIMAQIGNAPKLKRWNEENRQFFQGTTVLFKVAENGQLECLRYLIENPLRDMDLLEKEATVGQTVENGHIKCLKYLRETWGKNISNRPRYTEDAAKNGDLECLTYLISIQDIDDDMSIEGRERPLLAAAKNGHLACVEYLIEVGVSKACVKEACDAAKKNNHEKCRKYLQNYLNDTTFYAAFNNLLPQFRSMA